MPELDESDIAQIREYSAFGDTLTDRLLARPTQWYTVGAPPLQVFVPIGRPFVLVGRVTAMPEEFTAVVTESGAPWTVMDLAIENRRVVCTRITFLREPGAPPLRVTDFRRRPVDQLRLQAAALVSARVEVSDSDHVTLRHNDGSAREALQDYRSASRERGRGVRISDDELKRFAADFRQAARDSGEKHAVYTLQGRLHMSRTTIYRWVNEARKRGFLPNPQNR